MRVGITATREGLTAAQRATVAALLIGATEAHHGDCVGGDEEFHELAREANLRGAGIRIHVHPPDKAKLRAFCVGDVLHEAKPYLKRNEDIVRAVDLLIVCPSESVEPRPARGQGTWSCCRFARKAGRARVIVWPNGGLEWEHALVQSVAQTPVGDREEE